MPKPTSHECRLKNWYASARESNIIPNTGSNIKGLVLFFEFLIAFSMAPMDWGFLQSGGSTPLGHRILQM
jgi:hypothetical protein